MNMFKSFVFILFFILTNWAFSLENGESSPPNMRINAANLWGGYFDVANLKESYDYYDGIPNSHAKDSIDGIYLFVEGGWDGSCCVSPYYTRLTIGKNIEYNKKDNIWIIADSLNLDSLNSELKKGNPLSLDDFKKMEFDSLHTKYVVSATYHDEIEYEKQVFRNGSFYILYQNDQLKSAFCGITSRICYFQIGCFYQDGGALTFDSVPDPSKLVVSDDCLDGGGSSLQPMVRNLKKQNDWDKSYKVNGVPAIRNSSNIVIRKNKQPKLQLKGN